MGITIKQIKMGGKRLQWGEGIKEKVEGMNL
jgi:hypothetical protein